MNREREKKCWLTSNIRHGKLIILNFLSANVSTHPTKKRTYDPNRFYGGYGGK